MAAADTIPMVPVAASGDRVGPIGVWVDAVPDRSYGGRPGFRDASRAPFHSAGARCELDLLMSGFKWEVHNDVTSTSALSRPGRSGGLSAARPASELRDRLPCRTRARGTREPG